MITEAIPVVFGIIFILAGAFTAYVNYLCVKGRIKPNGAVGVRLSFSKNARLYLQERYWYDINRYGGKKGLMLSPAWVLMGIILIVLPIDAGQKIAVIFAMLAIVIIGEIIIGLQSYRYAERLVSSTAEP